MSRPHGMLKSWLLPGMLVLIALGADLLSPADPATQRRELIDAPPVTVRFVDADGEFHPRPFVYPRRLDHRSGEPRWVDDREHPTPLRLLPRLQARRGDGALVEIRPLVGVEPPADLALLGTDAFGRDLLSRTLHGTRRSLASGLLAATLAVGLGLVLGLAAGFRGGAVDALLMRAVELLATLPALYLLFAARAFLPLDLSPDDTFLTLVLLLAAVGWARPARLVRGVAASVRERDYVLAARGFGASEATLLRRHILPETLAVALTQWTLLVPQYIVAEAVLSFFGLGIAEPAAGLGNLLRPLEQPQRLAEHPWLVAPAIVLVIATASFQGLASALQARLDDFDDSGLDKPPRS